MATLDEVHVTLGIPDTGTGEVPTINALLRGSYTNRSLVITTGGTSQQLMAANTIRKRLIVQNPSSASESIFINFGAAAVVDSNSIEIPPGGTHEESAPATTEAVNVIAATTGHVVIAKEM